MKIYTLKYEQFVGMPLDEVFSFFSRPENLALITPSWLGFVILTPSPLEMRNGVLISYAIRIAGIRVRWISMITSYEPPHQFTDEQLRGPYSFWHHRHMFREEKGGTMVIDELRYAVPFGIVGRIVRKVFIRRQLEKIFSYRAEAIKKIFAGERSSSI